MRSLSAAELLNIWERGTAQSPVQRALALLAAAYDDTPPNRLAQLSIAQRDARLMTLREWAFGPRVAGLAARPACGEPVELGFDNSDIRVAGPLPDGGAAGAEPGSFELGVGNYALCFRVPNRGDMAAMAGYADVAAGRRQLFARCVLGAERDGAEVPAAELPDDIVAAVIAAMAEADPQSEVQIELACPACTGQWHTTFDILSFFWHEIDVWAQRVLRDVHVLALAYGWREADILALSPRRRQLYLEMIG